MYLLDVDDNDTVVLYAPNQLYILNNFLANLYN